MKTQKKQYGENDTKTDAWKISLNNAEAQLSDLNNELKDNKSAMEKAKNPTSEMATEVKQFGNNADTAGEKSLKMGDIIKANLISSAIIGGVKELGSAMLSVGKNAVSMISNTIDATSEISDSAQKNWNGNNRITRISIRRKPMRIRKRNA